MVRASQAPCGLSGANAERLLHFPSWLQNRKVRAMTEEEAQKIRTDIAALKGENERLWAAINSLRHNPAIDVPRIDKLMQVRYGIRQQVIRR